MSQNIDKNIGNEAKKKILQHANDVMHDELTNKNSIVVVAVHSRADPRKFTIVADSEYERALEGVTLTFDNPEDFARVFPDFARPPPVTLGPNMEMDSKRGVAVPIHKDPYPIAAAYSIPKPANEELNSAENVINKNDDAEWAVNKNPATLLLDMGYDIDIGTVWVKWNNDNFKQYKFTIAVATEEQFAKEPKEFAVIPDLQEVYSNGTAFDMEPYNLSTDPEILTKARYVLIKIYGNTIDDWAIIKHVDVTKAMAIKSMHQKEPFQIPDKDI